MFGLTLPRELLYRRIEERVDQMIASGLVAEVKALLNQGVPPDAKSMQSLGYRQVVDYLLGKLSFDTAVELIKRDTRRFAKRQLTWFRREQDVVWINLSEAGGIRNAAENICNSLAGYSKDSENN